MSKTISSYDWETFKNYSVHAGQTAAGTDQEKLLAQLEAELKESQHLVRLQQQMLQVLPSNMK